MWQHQTKPMALAFLVSWIFMWAVIAIVLFCGCACGPQYPREYTQYKSGVRITVTCMNMTSETPVVVGWYGSGVIVSTKTVLTAGHVANLPKNMECGIEAVDTDGVHHMMRNGIVDTERDIASMHVIDKPFNSSSIEYGIVPIVGSPVCSDTAYPDRIHLCGKIHGWYKGWVTSDMIVEPGNSGSGVYDSDGKLIGIVVHFVKNEYGVYLGSHFIPVANLLLHLPELLKE